MAVIGTGLIGTSIALAARRRDVTVFLSDRDPLAARTAAALGAGRAGTPARPVDLAVIAVPPSQVAGVLTEAQAHRIAVGYTDVASVKAGPERAALSRAPDPERYVGGHPLAGRERSGPLAARAELFQGRTWVLTPSRATSSATLAAALSLVEVCGAEPVVMRSQEHDAAVAVTSHVPHLVASLMAARLRDGPAGAALVAGQGWRDVTRIAGGDSGLWGDILQSNAAAITGVLRELHADLSRLVPALDALAQPGHRDRERAMRTLVDLLDRGVLGASGVPGTRQGGAAGDPRVRVRVPGRPGELARLTADLAGLDVAAEDADVDADGDGLAVRFTVPPALADRRVAELRAAGWTAEREDAALPV